MSTQQIFSRIPKINRLVSLIEEEEDWVTLFEPNSGENYALDPFSAFIWKNIDGKRNISNILALIRKNCINQIPKHAQDDLKDFIDALYNYGLVYFD